jgi:hypothetical protein
MLAAMASVVMPMRNQETGATSDELGPAMILLTHEAWGADLNNASRIVKSNAALCTFAKARADLTQKVPVAVEGLGSASGVTSEYKALLRRLLIKHPAAATAAAVVAHTHQQPNQGPSRQARRVTNAVERALEEHGRESGQRRAREEDSFVAPAAPVKKNNATKKFGAWRGK